MRPSLGDLRRKIQPWVLKYWLKKSDRARRQCRFGDLEIEILPSVFHPKYFGSTSILADFIEGLDLRNKTVLDMGSGTGVIGLRAARLGASVTAVDVNPVAVRCAEVNAASNDIQMEVIESDFFEVLGERRFDLVFWNPPFFPKPAKNPGERAFFAGEGFSVIGDFAWGLPAHLNVNGKCYFILTLDIDVSRVTGMFEDAGLRVDRAAAHRWGLGEQMIVLEASC